MKGYRLTGRTGRLRLRARPRRAGRNQDHRRWRTLLLALGLVGFGVVKCRTAEAMTYSNYWGGQVYAPFVVVAGLIVAAGALLGREPRPLVDQRGRPIPMPAEGHDRPWNPVG